ncbi:MAG: hypothetical protein F6J93_16800 [Oscillatoria sp. SIO1A7]|nr:hypothetical protein [Oscillatoria sp. SIO1A7]
MLRPETSVKVKSQKSKVKSQKSKVKSQKSKGFDSAIARTVGLRSPQKIHAFKIQKLGHCGGVSEAQFKIKKL